MLRRCTDSVQCRLHVLFMCGIKIKFKTITKIHIFEKELIRTKVNYMLNKS
jgi:hypothetical protein